VRQSAQDDRSERTRPVPRFQPGRQSRDHLQAHRCADRARLQLLHGVVGDARHATRRPSADDDALCRGDLSALLDRDAQGPRRMRADAIANVRRQFASGDFLQTLARRVAYKTESQSTGREAELRAYLDMEMRPSLAELDFESRLVESPSGKSPFLIAEHREDA